MEIRRQVLILIVCVLGGCHSVGPVTLTRDRLDYSSAIAESWKHQTLLNIVKLRYSDPPLFVDVGQIVGGYTLETSMNVEVTAGTEYNQTLGGGGRFTDRPTITYTPLTGSAFISGVITPIAPSSLVSAIQAGWPAETILPISVASINGIVNENFISGQFRPVDDRFFRVVELVRQLQISGLISFRIVKKPDSAAVVMALGNSDPDAMAATTELKKLLGLNADAREFSVVFGDTAANDLEVALKTRSILNILQLMSARAELPAEHIAAGRASSGAPVEMNSNLSGFRIRSARQEPKDAFVAINYRDTWFYIDDTDLGSKRIFSLLMLLFTLAETGAERIGPILTIPTG